MLSVLAEINKPEDVEITVSIKMPLKGWREVLVALKAESFGDRWHASNFRDGVREALRDIEYKSLKISRESDV